MNCPHCAHENPQKSRFCNRCGKPLIAPPTVASSLIVHRRDTPWGAYGGWGFLILLSALLTAAVLTNYLKGVDRRRAKRTLADIKTMAVTWETYYVDHKTYCLRDGTAGRFAWGNISYDALQRMLCPAYIRHLPADDAWGRPYQFAVRYADTGHQFYGIRSAGPDGLWAPDKKPFNADQFQDYDIVLITGAFLMSPEGYCPP